MEHDSDERLDWVGPARASEGIRRTHQVGRDRPAPNPSTYHYTSASVESRHRQSVLRIDGWDVPSRAFENPGGWYYCAESSAMTQIPASAAGRQGMSSKSIQGHCLCTAVKYTVAAGPLWCGHCHCGDCRRAVAGAVATFLGFEKKHFTVTRGKPRVFESSPGVRRSFCSNCGTPISYESDKVPGEIHVLLGTVDHPEAYPPQLEVFCKEKLPWLQLHVDGPSFHGLPEQT